ncbi:MAG: hypothetical protein JWO51_521 [Rhodospirillales bacterium]|nr:hypothetical protein [Rhodospirillales bacterium]
MPERYPPKLATEDARQGETSGHMRVVLTLSFIGAVIVLAALLVWWSKVGQNHLPAAVAAPPAISQPAH